MSNSQVDFIYTAQNYKSRVSLGVLYHLHSVTNYPLVQSNQNTVQGEKYEQSDRL